MSGGDANFGYNEEEETDIFTWCFKGNCNKCGKYGHKARNYKDTYPKDSSKDTSNKKQFIHLMVYVITTKREVESRNVGN